MCNQPLWASSMEATGGVGAVAGVVDNVEADVGQTEAGVGGEAEATIAFKKKSADCATGERKRGSASD